MEEIKTGDLICVVGFGLHCFNEWDIAEVTDLDIATGLDTIYECKGKKMTQYLVESEFIKIGKL